MKLYWNSSKGYSLPNELVTVIEHRDRISLIQSEGDAEDVGGPFFYWVADVELSNQPIDKD